MNQDISTLNLKLLIPWLRRSRKLITTLVILGLLGYSGYQISQITAVQPNQAYITTQTKANKVPSLHPNKQVLSQLKGLREPGDTTIQVTTGKQNPFAPN
jgi:predicted negative regulator of RcsB-dependent stress response